MPFGSIKGDDTPANEPSNLEMLVKGGFWGLGIVGAGLLARTAYTKYLLYFAPEVKPSEDRVGSPIRIYQWATKQGLGNNFWEKPGQLWRAQKGEDGFEKDCVQKGFIAGCKNKGITLYQESNDGEEKITRPIQEKDILEAIRYEQRRLTNYMTKLKWFTHAAEVYNSKKQEFTLPAELGDCTVQKENQIFKAMQEYINNIGSNCNNWEIFLQTAFRSFEKEAAQKWWDLFVARSRLIVLENIMIPLVAAEEARKEKEHEEQRMRIRRQEVSYTFGSAGTDQ